MLHTLLWQDKRTRPKHVATIKYIKHNRCVWRYFNTPLLSLHDCNTNTLILGDKTDALTMKIGLWNKKAVHYETSGTWKLCIMKRLGHGSCKWWNIREDLFLKRFDDFQKKQIWESIIYSRPRWQCLNFCSESVYLLCPPPPHPHTDTTHAPSLWNPLSLSSWKHCTSMRRLQSFSHPHASITKYRFGMTLTPACETVASFGNATKWFQYTKSFP